MRPGRSPQSLTTPRVGTPWLETRRQKVKRMVAGFAVLLQCISRALLAFLVVFIATAVLGHRVGTVSIGIALALSALAAFHTVRTKLPVYRNLDSRQSKRLLAISIVSATGWIVLLLAALRA